MQKRQSHTKIPSEVVPANNYYIMPKSLRSSLTSAENLEVKKVASTKNFDQFEPLYSPEKLLNTHQQNNAYQSNIDLQQALHFSEQNNQYLSRYHQQLQQNNVDLQSLYNKSEMENKKLLSELKLLQNRISLKDNELKQAQENGVEYLKEIAQLKIQIQKLNSTLTKLIEENEQIKEQLNVTGTQTLQFEKGLSSRRDLNQQNEFNLSGSRQSQNSRQQHSQSVSNLQINAMIAHDNISNYQNQILQYQKELAEKNQLITSLQQQVKNLTEFQRQLMAKSTRKQHNKGTKNQIQSSPQQTPIQRLRINNDSQIMSHKNLLNLIDDQQKPDFQLHRSRQSDEFDVGPSVKSSITNLKNKQELQQIYKKINQSTIYTSGLYSSLLDYQYLSSNKLLNSSCTKDTLQH
ncbi:unnamed protein product (macronuclear) [Paramecium tetraurelia]|uniref:Uncharacterized protein n=1 Tax=Paramecium tetraurelia TaxID=5888 RepID=A0C541_PARTE|nr:uncharacterized protein GSPATT00006407001 [Paramecium tetraurelia]CAK65908.1 unnamed protein product [Paramecium tetraurelia]|eukprot:XP_001433305.1 hypothetical protein (macronuclear) [Paramecium tetraurelia strain d4-2]